MQVPARDVPVLAEADVVVAGGGPAGLGAAVAATRMGARTVLCERYGVLGGNFTVASVGTICGLYVRDGETFAPVVGGIAREFPERLAAAGSGFGPVPFKESAVFVYTPWAAKRLADRIVLDESDLEVLLHSLVADAIVDDGALRALVVATKQGPRSITARAFVDCTGDADVAWFAGAETAVAPAEARQRASMQFVMQHVDDEQGRAAIATLAGTIAAHGRHLSRDSGAVIPTLRPGEFIGAMTRVANPDGSAIDPTDVRDMTAGEFEGRRRAEEAAAFLRERVPGFADAFLADTAMQLGVRESRRIVGEYVLRGDDVVGGARFDDAVAAGAWPQEYHTHGRSTEYRFLEPGRTYQIPFRSLLPVGVRNLFVAGRCMSADHDALASTRVMAPSMALGQAAGTAAAIAARDGTDAGAVDGYELQDALARAGAIW